MDTGIRSLRKVFRNGSCSDWPLAMTFSLFFKQADGREHNTGPFAVAALKRGSSPQPERRGGLQSFVHHRDRTRGYRASNATRSSAVWRAGESRPGRVPPLFRADSHPPGAPTAVDI